MDALVIECMLVHRFLQWTFLDDLCDDSLVVSDLPHDLHNVDLFFVLLEAFIKELIEIRLLQAAPLL